MIKKLVWNDVKQNKLLAGATVFFMGVSAMLFALTALLFFHLMGAIDDMMDRAKVPDYMQMHTEGGILQGQDGAAMERNATMRSELRSFVSTHGEVDKWQICGFLNLDNSQIVLGCRCLADSTQDNGCSVQGEHFDYLLDTENEMPEDTK